MRHLLLLVLLLTSCTRPYAIRETLDRTEETLARAHTLYANRCAPELLANARHGPFAAPNDVEMMEYLLN